MKKISMRWIRQDVAQMKMTRGDGNLDDHEYFEYQLKLWSEKHQGRNYVKELLWDSYKLASEIAAVADEKTKKKVKIYQRQKKDPTFIPFDVRDKMDSLSLFDHVEAVWGIKFRMNACQCKLPWHKDKTASFHIYPLTNSFNCFGCQKWGSLLDFLIHNDKMEMKQAIDYIKHL